MLVRGERGTAKSTAVRALAPLLPSVPAAVDETFAFAPWTRRAPGGMVALRGRRSSCARRRSSSCRSARRSTGWSGALDLRRALAGEQRVRAGLLARAHRGHPLRRRGQPAGRPSRRRAARRRRLGRRAGRARGGVGRARRALPARRDDERRGGRAAPAAARPLRPRRGGARTPREPAERAEIVRRRLAFERRSRRGSSRDCARGRARARCADRRGARAPRRGRACPSASCCGSPARAPQLGVDGVRGDIVTARAARALAALDGADEVDEAHVRRAAALALAHRRRRDPLDGRQPDPEDVERALDGAPDSTADGAPPPMTPRRTMVRTEIRMATGGWPGRWADRERGACRRLDGQRWSHGEERRREHRRNAER